jgi:hypothetical protein
LLFGSFYFGRKENAGVANEQNLIPNSERTPSELREIAQKGGYASGVARRKRKALRDSMNALLEMRPTMKDFDKLIEAGFNPEEIDNSVLIAFALFNESKKGNVKAIKELRNLIGEDKPDSDAEYTKVDELIASIDRLAKT